ncbi:prepilin peptidase [Rubrimonas cliftonensis]|uniref:Prepilin peptidase CpaA n=1 Tax=Rubrimonas cliftonensis TaxID=89524 RepID=A0A1H4CJ80_9RHOB|nr:prepilin peptidase [Rubrimonas cliftonensis]SEA60491.1 prepilin peptidase CpaA [Rubrimonas cliftonensis]
MEQPSIIALGLLAAAAACDAARRLIPDAVSVALAISGAAWSVWHMGPAGFGATALAAAAVFAGGAALFFVGAMGGGDVKLAAAATLWLPVAAVPDFLLLTSLFGAALALAYGAARFAAALAGGAPGGAALVLARRAQAPYGVAIAGAGALIISAGAV